MPDDTVTNDPAPLSPSTVIDLDGTPGTGGVVWSTSPPGVHVNLVVLDAGGSIGSHLNDAVDVVIVTLAGAAVLSIDDAEVELEPHRAVVIPRGARRGVSAGSPGVRYLTIHQERPPLDIAPRPDRSD